MPNPKPPPPKSRAGSPSGKASASPPDAERLRLKAAIDAQVAALVARAAAECWPISADHCFLRIAYDNAVEAQWDRVCPRPAWRHLPPDRLAAALATLLRIASEGVAALRPLNAASLAWRRANGAA